MTISFSLDWFSSYGAGVDQPGFSSAIVPKLPSGQVLKLKNLVFQDLTPMVFSKVKSRRINFENIVYSIFYVFIFNYFREPCLHSIANVSTKNIYLKLENIPTSVTMKHSSFWRKYEMETS